MKVQAKVLLYVSSIKSYQPGEAFDPALHYKPEETKALLARGVIGPVADLPTAESANGADTGDAAPPVKRKGSK